MHRHPTNSPRKPGRALFAAFAACAVLLAAGCASPNVNPAKPHARAGYVDFFCDRTNELSWEIESMGSNTQPGRTLYSEFDPLKEKILRLAFPPGTCRLQVSFLNQVIAQSGIVDVEVKDGMITPVRVTLVPSGTIQVESRERQFGPTYYGRAGRSTVFKTREATVLRVEARAEAPLPYQRKEQMPYAGAPGS